MYAHEHTYSFSNILTIEERKSKNKIKSFTQNLPFLYLQINNRIKNKNNNVK